MEYFEKNYIYYLGKKAVIWWRYVDNVFATWSHNLDDNFFFL